jgi:predicted metal-dependent hydrolase
VDELNNLHFGFKFGRVVIKEQSTRWGSCSSDGNINLNFKLLLASQDALDYVIVHELAHLREHNHSESFWQLVRRAIPGYADTVSWLKENGDRLGVSGTI